MCVCTNTSIPRSATVIPRRRGLLAAQLLLLAGAALAQSPRVAVQELDVSSGSVERLGEQIDADALELSRGESAEGGVGGGGEEERPPYAPDGLHPNEWGYGMWAEQIVAKVRWDQ